MLITFELNYLTTQKDAISMKIIIHVSIKHKRVLFNSREQKVH